MPMRSAARAARRGLIFDPAVDRRARQKQMHTVQHSSAHKLPMAIAA